MFGSKPLQLEALPPQFALRGLTTECNVDAKMPIHSTDEIVSLLREVDIDLSGERVRRDALFNALVRVMKELGYSLGMAVRKRSWANPIWRSVVIGVENASFLVNDPAHHPIDRALFLENPWNVIAFAHELLHAHQQSAKGNSWPRRWWWLVKYFALPSFRVEVELEAQCFAALISLRLGLRNKLRTSILSGLRPPYFTGHRESRVQLLADVVVMQYRANGLLTAREASELTKEFA